MSDITTTTQDATLAIAVRTQTFATDLIERMQARLSDEEGQTAAEYMGILMIIGLVIAALISLKIDQKIKTGVGDALSKISGGK